MLLRPEQEHGSSGKGDVLVPVAGRDRDVDDSLAGKELSLPYLNRHPGVAAAAGSLDTRAFAEHSRDSKRIPNAVCEPGASADVYRERRRDTGKRRRAP